MSNVSRNSRRQNAFSRGSGLGGGRRGFALPSAIFALVVVALLVTAGFYISGQERQIGQSTVFGAQAELLAEAGLAERMVTWTPANEPLAIGATSAEGSGRVDALNGEWRARVTRVGDRLYLVESTGAVDQAGRYSGASRTVGMLARLITAEFNASAALLTRGNVETRGGASISGFDMHPPGAMCTGPLEDQAGVVTSDGSAVTSRGNSIVEGDPRDGRHSVPPDQSLLRFGEMTYEQLAARAEKVLPGGNINNTGPDFDDDGECDTANPLVWGDPLRTEANPACVNYYPIIHVQGSARIQSGGVGQGVLLVDGDLDLRGNFLFHGIILVKGQVEVQGGGNRVFGAVVADNGLTIDPNLSTFVGSSVVQYSSCAIANTLSNLSGLTGLERVDNRAWIDLSLAGS